MVKPLVPARAPISKAFKRAMNWRSTWHSSVCANGLSRYALQCLAWWASNRIDGSTMAGMRRRNTYCKSEAAPVCAMRTSTSISQQRLCGQRTEFCWVRANTKDPKTRTHYESSNLPGSWSTASFEAVQTRHPSSCLPWVSGAVQTRAAICLRCTALPSMRAFPLLARFVTTSVVIVLLIGLGTMAV
jgi:hypothetical protein